MQKWYRSLLQQRKRQLKRLMLKKINQQQFFQNKFIMQNKPATFSAVITDM